MKQVSFKNWNCKVVKEEYRNNATALLLVDASDDSPIATATVNLTEESIDFRKYIVSEILPKNVAYIKTWSENEGMLEALEEAGIVKDLKIKVPVGPYGSTATQVEILI